MSDDLIRRLLSHHHMSQGDSFACLLATGREAAAELTRLRAKVEAAEKLAEALAEAVDVVHKAYVAATMEAVNAGPATPLLPQLEAWRIRCMNAETKGRAALSAYEGEKE